MCSYLLIRNDLSAARRAVTVVRKRVQYKPFIGKPAAAAAGYRINPDLG